MGRKVRIKRSKNLRFKLISILYLLFLVMAMNNLPNQFLNINQKINKNLSTNNELFEEKRTTDSSSESAQFRLFQQQINAGKARIREIKARFLKKNNADSANVGFLENPFGIYPTNSFFLNDHYSDSVRLALKQVYDIMESDSLLNKLDRPFPIAEKLPNAEDVPVDWEDYFFKDAPTIYALGVLEQFRAQLSLLEYRAARLYKTAASDRGKQQKGIAGESEALSLKMKGRLLPVEGQKISFSTNAGAEVQTYMVSNGDTLLPFYQSSGVVEFLPRQPGDYKVYTEREGVVELQERVRIFPAREKVQMVNEQVLYAGIANPVEVVVPAGNDLPLRLQSERAVIRGLGDNRYNVVFPDTGRRELRITTQIQEESVVYDTKIVRVQPLPNPAFRIAGFTGKLISKSRLQNLSKPALKGPGIPEGAYELESFKVTLQHNNNLYSWESTSGNWPREFLQMTGSLKPGDRLIIHQVKAQGRDGLQKNGHGLNLEIAR